LVPAYAFRGYKALHLIEIKLLKYRERRGPEMLIILIIVLVLLLGGGGGYFGYSRWGAGGGAGIGLGTVLVILLVCYLLGFFR
jgi:hypothetical protein